MKFISDRLTAFWLQNFIPDHENFDWDKGNKGKNKKHQIDDEQIEGLFWEFEYVFMGKIVEPECAEWRGAIVVAAETGRYWTLIFTRRGEKVRVISCRPSRKEEKKYYEETI